MKKLMITVCAIFVGVISLQAQKYVITTSTSTSKVGYKITGSQEYDIGNDTTTYKIIISTNGLQLNANASIKFSDGTLLTSTSPFSTSSYSINSGTATYATTSGALSNPNYYLTTDQTTPQITTGTFTFPNLKDNSLTQGQSVYASTGGLLVGISNNNTSTEKFLAQTSSGVPSWQTIPTAGSLTYYFQATASSISTYKQMISTPYTPKTTLATSGVSDQQVLANFATNANFPNLTFIPAGQYEFHIHAAKTGGTQTTVMFAEFWEVSSTGTDIAKIGTSEQGSSMTSAETEYRVFFVSSNTYTLQSTASRIVCRIKVGVSGGGSSPSVSIYYGDEADSHIALPSNTVDATNFTPYVGATQPVNLGIYGVTTSSDITANHFKGDGSFLTSISSHAVQSVIDNNIVSISASKINAGSLGSGVIASSVAAQSIQDNAIVAVSGSKVTAIPAANISAGSLGTSVIASSGAGNAFVLALDNGSNTMAQNNGNGHWQINASTSAASFSNLTTSSATIANLTISNYTLHSSTVQFNCSISTGSASNNVGASGQVLISQGAGNPVTWAGGRILQIVTSSTTASTGTGNATFTLTNSSITFIPKSSNSVVFITVSGTWQNTNPRTYSSYATIYRNTTTNLGGANGIAVMGAGSSFPTTAVEYLPCSMTAVDSPGTTDATTYAVYIRVDSGGSVTWAALSTQATITLMEIGQ